MIKKREIKRKRSQRGISVMIGYILLISLAVIMGGIIYTWAKTYIPSEEIGCDEGISMFVKEVDCSDNITHLELNLTLKNNGRFSFGGFQIYGSNKTGVELATIDLSGNLATNQPYIVGGNNSWLKPGVKFPGEENQFDPQDEEYVNFSIPLQDFNEILSIDLIPMRWQTIDGKSRVLSCGNSKVRQELICS